MAWFDDDAIRARRADLQARYPVLHPELARLAPALLAPAARALLGGHDATLRESLSSPLPEVLTFPLFSSATCRALIREVEHFERWCRATATPVARPSSMHRYGAILDDLGLEPMLDDLIARVVVPLAADRFGDAGGGTLDGHHGFVAAYDMDTDRDLDLHVDASDVTLNVCLGTDFEGGELAFTGVRCERCLESTPHPGELAAVPQRPGWAILHRGKHRHRARPITSGSRRSLIVWCMSTRFRDEQARTGWGVSRCPPWCRRTTTAPSPGEADADLETESSPARDVQSRIPPSG